MSYFLSYQLAQAQAREAEARVNAANRTYDLTKIHERLAEIKSQADPLNMVANDTRMGERDKLIAIANYVVHGRDAL